jgi:predicted acetyltransferase
MRPRPDWPSSAPIPCRALPETLQYRFAEPDEIADVGRLVAHSFPGGTRTPAWWQDQLREPLYGGGAQTLFLGAESGRTVAALQLHPLREWIAGEALAVAGVGTVAIAPTHRRRRLGAELVIAALRAARDRGDAGSALYPFRTSFYQRLGYGVAGEALQYQIAPSSLPDSAERRLVELLEGEAARREALELYGRWARGQTGQLERGERVWTHICTAPDRALVGYRARGGGLEGYCLVAYRTDLPRPKRFLEVEELVWTSPQARRGLYGWLASLADQWEQLLIRALPSHRFLDWIGEPRLPHGAAPNWGLWAPAATLLLGPMFRLVDMHAAWSSRRVPPRSPLTVGLEVGDAQIEQNRGGWRLVFDGGRVQVERDGRAELSLRLDISTLSRLYIGSLTPTHALEAGLLVCDHPDMLAALDDALALPEPWTFDRF